MIRVRLLLAFLGVCFGVACAPSPASSNRLSSTPIEQNSTRLLPRILSFRPTGLQSFLSAHVCRNTL